MTIQLVVDYPSQEFQADRYLWCALLYRFYMREIILLILKDDMDNRKWFITSGCLLLDSI